ncbi:MAG: SAM-dependent methyltransferase [Desulforhopalus sp.]|jgi:SAM-dependent methyltransferase
MVKIYDDYGDEPEDEFIPLPDHLACSYYDLEMDSYEEDAIFFNSLLPNNATILELGCGSGRVGRHLAKKSRSITGVDISLPMLEKAKGRKLSKMHFLAMDMTALAFNHPFDSIIVPYNSLNLLITKERILRCLVGCKQYLQPGGLLIAQIFIPTKRFLSDKKKSFQFQILDMQPNGRIIKEILKQYNPDSKTISVEERFRVRPTGPHATLADYNSNYTVAAYELADWLQLFKTADLTIRHCYEDFQKTPTHTTDSPCLLIVCE